MGRDFSPPSSPRRSSTPLPSPFRESCLPNSSFPPFLFKHFRTLPFSVSCNPFVCHSYENCRGVYQQFPFWNSLRPNYFDGSRSLAKSLQLAVALRQAYRALWGEAKPWEVTNDEEANSVRGDAGGEWHCIARPKYQPAERPANGGDAYGGFPGDADPSGQPSVPETPTHACAARSDSH